LHAEEPFDFQAFVNVRIGWWSKLCELQPRHLYLRSLAITENAFGLEHPDVATSLNNLALLYDNQGQYGKVEPLYLHTLAMREQALWPREPPRSLEPRWLGWHTY
jgi:hypothetical protein